MSEIAGKKATYEDLLSLPDHVTGEILGGELIATPRPSMEHSMAASTMGAELLPPFQLGRGGGPGGWVILDEVEVMLGEDLLVPDLAGWRKERFPGRPEKNYVTVPPDWVCEVLSPATARKDRVLKMPVYAQHAVGHVWLVDPAARTLEVFRLESGRWLLLNTFGGEDLVRAEPFDAIEIQLGDLWMEK